jgi:hypothetical protein
MTNKRKRTRKRTNPSLFDGRFALSPREFAAVAGISVTLLYRLWREGRGPPSKMLFKRRVIEVEGGRKWLAERDARVRRDV